MEVAVKSLSPEERAQVFDVLDRAKSAAMTELADVVVLMVRAGWISSARAYFWAIRSPEARRSDFVAGDLGATLRRVRGLENVGRVLLGAANKAGSDLKELSEPLVSGLIDSWDAVWRPLRWLAGAAVVAGVVGGVVVIYLVVRK